MRKFNISTFHPLERSAKAVGARLIPTPARVRIVKIEAIGEKFENDLTRWSITSELSRVRGDIYLELI